MQLAPVPVLVPGSIAGIVKSPVRDMKEQVIAGPVVGDAAFTTQQQAFAAAYAASIGAEQGAVIVTRGRAGFVLQYALAPVADGAPSMPYAFEQRELGDRPIAVRGGLPAAVVAILDGASIIQAY